MAPLRRGVLIALLFAAALTLSSCGGTPTSPAASTVPTALTLLPEIDELPVGGTADLTLVVTFADGRRTQMSPTWGSANPAVLKVQPISTARQGVNVPEDINKVVDHILVGRLTGISAGEANVYAVCQHGRAERGIRVTSR